MIQPVRLVLLRHGQSECNAAGIFTGWENAHLTAHGEAEAARAGSMLVEHGVLPVFVHTSLQHRTIRTADLALAAADRDWIPVRRSWRLNGRHYGALQGRNKDQVLRQYGERQFRLWRRSYDVAPPPVTAEARQLQLDDPRYAILPPEAQPRAEALRDVSARLLPYWYDAIVPDLLAGGCVLVVSHGNTLRALVKHLESFRRCASWVRAFLFRPGRIPGTDQVRRGSPSASPPARGRSSTNRCFRPGRGGSARTASTTTASAAPVQASISRVGSPSVSTSATPGDARSRRRATAASPAPSSRRNSLLTPITVITRRPGPLASVEVSYVPTGPARRRATLDP
jgi:2,3-bisphosphoglycerate-dependent phosphoglycerate mutase